MSPTPAQVRAVMRHIRSKAPPESMARPATARKAALASWSPAARAKRAKAKRRKKCAK